MARCWQPVLLALAIGTPAAHAARPLDTEDAGANERATCQTEAWADHGHAQHEVHAGAACGVGGGLELGAEVVLPNPRRQGTKERSAGAKFAPEWLDWGQARLALKWMGTQAREAGTGEDWHWKEGRWLSALSLVLSPEWTLHANLGHTFQRGPGKTVRNHAAGLVWTPDDHWLLFGELVADNHAPANQTVGLRYWVIPEVLGVDLTHSRTNATRGSHHSAVGVGWYGITF